MSDPKQAIIDLISDIETGKTPADKAWHQITTLKDEYVKQLGQQSWNSFIGHRFQGVIHAILKGYVKKLKEESHDFIGLEVLTAGEAQRNEVIMRKLAVKYGDYLLLPDVDSALVWIDSQQRWESKILAVISCKTSLRERIAQACYWKLKLLSSDVQKGIKVFLTTADNDDDFVIGDGGERFNGRSRDRVISEHELDGVYILREDFETGWESLKIKRFERIFDDILEIMKNKAGL
ncbi:MAG: restriction endonuclease [Chloroflexi bacterium]|nr:restriction endonuclease [Chloroflexota bacterium]